MYADSTGAFPSTNSTACTSFAFTVEALGHGFGIGRRIYIVMAYIVMALGHGFSIGRRIYIVMAVMVYAMASALADEPPSTSHWARRSRRMCADMHLWHDSHAAVCNSARRRRFELLACRAPRHAVGDADGGNVCAQAYMRLELAAKSRRNCGSSQ